MLFVEPEGDIFHKGVAAPFELEVQRQRLTYYIRTATIIEGIYGLSHYGYASDTQHLIKQFIAFGSKKRPHFAEGPVPYSRFYLFHDTCKVGTVCQWFQFETHHVRCHDGRGNGGYSSFGGGIHPGLQHSDLCRNNRLVLIVFHRQADGGIREVLRIDRLQHCPQFGVEVLCLVLELIVVTQTQFALGQTFEVEYRHAFVNFARTYVAFAVEIVEVQIGHFLIHV